MELGPSVSVTGTRTPHPPLDSFQLLQLCQITRVIPMNGAAVKSLYCIMARNSIDPIQQTDTEC